MTNSQHKILGLFVALALVLLVSGCTDNIVTSGNIGKFSSESDLKTYLDSRQSSSYFGYYGGARDFAVPTTALDTASGSSINKAESSSLAADDFSTTNIQVEGVDEPDFMKNDNKYIYTVSDGQVHILEVYPAEDAKLIHTLELDGTAEQLFLNDNKLVVFGREPYKYDQSTKPVPLNEDVQEAPTSNTGAKIASDAARIMPIYYNPKSFINVYDITNKENPKLIDSVSYDGDFNNARMINDHVYVIINQPIQYTKDNIIMPAIESSGRELSIFPTDIYYFNIYDYGYRLTTVLSLDLNSKDSVEKQTFLTGYTQNIYVSKDNIYLTSQKQVSPEYTRELLVREVYTELFEGTSLEELNSILDDNTLTESEKIMKIQELYYDYYNKLSESKKQDLNERYQDLYEEAYKKIQRETQKTIIYKINIDQGSINYQGSGEVPGIPLNQFSMDEYKDNFRIATTSGEIWDNSASNNVYVLDSDLEIVGKLENLGLKERIYSTRFIGDRLYMVTFKNTDPLYVIDLKNPSNPKVLGELKIPGYSNYLHPYDETHLIGLGKDAIVDTTVEEGSVRDSSFAYYQGVKVSLFDVSDVSDPKEISKFNIGDRGTDSEALYDHRAFLFDKARELLVIPITLAEIDRSQYQDNVPLYAYGQQKFQGAYVFSLNLEDGFKYKGRITHSNVTYSDIKSEPYFYFDYYTQIRRSLYMDNILYTVSSVMVKANDLSTLEEISSVDLPVQPSPYYGLPEPFATIDKVAE